MKLLFTHIRLTKLVLLLCILATIACKKDNKEEKESRTAKSVSLAVLSGTPGDIVATKTSFKLDKDNWQIFIGEKPVQLARLNDSVAVFTIPYLSPGSTFIDLSNLGITEKLSFNVLDYIPVSNPEEAAQSFTTRLSEAIGDVSSQEDKALLTALKQTFDDRFAKLTIQEKEEVAFAIQKIRFQDASNTSTQSAVKASNHSFTLAFDGIRTSDQLFPIRVPQSINSDREFYSAIVSCGALTTLSGSLLVGGAAGLVAPTGVTQLIGLATFSYSIYVGHKAILYCTLIKNYSGENTSVEQPVILGTVNSMASSMKSAGLPSIAANAGVGNLNDLVFRKDISYSVSVVGKYRKVSRSTNNAVLQNFIGSINSFAALYNTAAQKLNAIKAWFSNDPEVPTFAPGFAATATDNIKGIASENVYIENISDPQITVSKSATGSNIILKFRSNTISGEKAFTFDIVYKNNNLGITNRKTVSAIFDGNLHPENLEIAGGNNQTGQAGKKLENPLEVLVLDANGNPLNGISVQWLVKSGGGTLSAATSLTDVNGVARTEWTPGNQGTQEVQAIVKKRDGSSVTGSPALFTIGANWLFLIAGNHSKTWKVTQFIWNGKDELAGKTPSIQ